MTRRGFDWRRTSNWEYRWRALPLFLSQGGALIAQLAANKSFELPVPVGRGLVAVLLAFTGVWLRVWGTGIISASTMASMKLDTGRLEMGGVYALIRHPLYLCDLLIFTAYGILLSPWMAVLFGTYHWVRTMRLIEYEERFLRERWGAIHDAYCRRVPSLLPRLERAPAAYVNWLDGLAGSSIWLGFALGYLASLLTGTLWALAPIETAGFLFAAYYFSKKRNRASPVTVDV